MTKALSIAGELFLWLLCPWALLLAELVDDA